MRAALAAALCLLAAAADAQQGTRIAEGRVLRAIAGAEPLPVRGQWVVLHRVGADRAGPVDSVRSAADGRFRFRYQATGSAEALYFVSAMYGGIAYFSPPLRSAAVRGGDADVLVYDTTNDTTTLRVQGRHIVVSQLRGSRREIAEVFEIENQGARTVTALDTAPLWAVTLPEAAESASVAPGDISAAAVRFTRGRAALFAPLSPGVRQIVFTYLLPNDAFPVSFPALRPTPVLEILLEDPRGRASGVPLREVDAATIEGRTFRRLLAQDVAASAVVRIDMPPPPGRNRGALVAVTVALAAAMLIGLALWFSSRKGAAGAHGTPRGQSESEVERLVADLAAMDARHERTAPHDPDDDAEHQRRRAELKQQIERMLAAEPRSS